MLTLISATPGSGKTLKSIEIIFELLNKGYIVYANIIGLKIPGVIHISTNEDWRNLDSFKHDQPELADKPIAVFYDEAHEHPAFAKENLIADKKELEIVRDIGRALAMHRQFGFDIYLITQFPNDLAPFVLGRVGRHLFLRRVFNMKRCTIYEYPEAHTSFPKSVREDAVNKTIWKFPKQLYDYYVSTELDTHKSNIPLKYILLILFVFVCLPAYLARSFWIDPLFGHKKEEVSVINPSSDKQNIITGQANQTIKKPIDSSTKEDLQNIENKRVSMVIESSNDCVAKNSYGEVLDITLEECRLLSRKNTRIPLSRLKRETKDELPHSHSSIEGNSNTAGFDPTQPGKISS